MRSGGTEVKRPGRSLSRMRKRYRRVGEPCHCSRNHPHAAMHRAPLLTRDVRAGTDGLPGLAGQALPQRRAKPCDYSDRRAPVRLFGRGATKATSLASVLAVALPVMSTRSAMSGMNGLAWPKVPDPFMRTS